MVSIEPRETEERGHLSGTNTHISTVITCRVIYTQTQPPHVANMFTVQRSDARNSSNIVNLFSSQFSLVSSTFLCDQIRTDSAFERRHLALWRTPLPGRKRRRSFIGSLKRVRWRLRDRRVVVSRVSLFRLELIVVTVVGSLWSAERFLKWYAPAMFNTTATIDWWHVSKLMVPISF